VDTIRFGRQARALRRRRGWRQIDLAVAAKLSRGRISRVELGHADELTLASLEAIAKALGARLNVAMTWNGEALDRLLDADHAALVEIVASTLHSLEWQVAVEVSFNIRGEWGSIDILAFHPATGVILVVEVKTVVPDLQATIFTLDRKTRLALEIALERGWRGRAVGRILVVAESRTNRRRIASHGATFDSAFPARTTAVKRWLGRPSSADGFSGLWILANDRGVSARQRVASRTTRIRA
jgi:transcriptional regulator with XRE-family HTH domain